MSTGNFTRTDNIFISTDMIQTILSCNTVPEQQPAKSDHLPVDTVIDISPAIVAYTSRANFRQVDWEDFSRGLQECLRGSAAEAEPTSMQEFEQQLRAV